jgi:N4-gp56 family major capsid protein
MANSTTTTLNDLISPIVQEAMFVASESSIMPGLVKQFTVPANAGKVLQIPLYPVNTIASDAGEATDLAGGANDVAVSTGVANIELTEAGIMTVLTDMARNHSVSNVVADLGKLFGEAIAKRHDRALTGLFSSFTSQIGAAGDELEVKDLFEAYATLKANAVPGPYFGVFNPKSIYNIKKTLTNTFVNPNASSVVNQAMSEGYVGRIAGIDIFESSNVVEDSATGVTNGVFSRDALGLAVAQNINIETQRDASLRAEEVVASTRYGVSVLHNSYGIKVLGDNQIN